MNHLRLSAHLFAHEHNLDVFRILPCKHQTTDSSNLLSCSPCSSDCFVVSNEYASGKCIRVKVYILIKKFSGVKYKLAEI